MADNNFLKVKNGLRLSPQTSTPSQDSSGDMYYDATKGVSLNNSNLWDRITSVSSLPSQANITSAQADSVMVENSLVAITGTTNTTIHGLTPSFLGKKIFILNDTDKTIIFDHLSVTELNAAARLSNPNGLPVFVSPGLSVQFYYNGSNWRMIGQPGNEATYQDVIVNNQVSPDDIASAVISAANYRGFIFDYYISRRYESAFVLDSTFTSAASDSSKFGSQVVSTAVQSDGKVLAAGIFTAYAGTATRDYLVRLNSDGTPDSTFCTNAVDGAKFSSTVQTVAVQADGKILVGGSFINYAGTSGRDHLIRLNADGTVDSAFCTNASDGSKITAADVYFIKVQADGKILVGGNFVNYGGTIGRNLLIRLNSDGTLDTTFCTNAVDGAKFGTGAIYSVDESPLGTIVVGGLFSNYNSTSGRNNLVVLNQDGTLNTTATSNASDSSKFNSAVQSVAMQPDEKILAGGSFTNYAGTSGRDRFVRLNSDGTTDTSFCANASDGSKISSSTVIFVGYIDSAIYIGGGFSNYSGTTGLNRFVKLNTDGTTDSTFATSHIISSKFSNTVNHASFYDGELVIGGAFANYAGTSGRDFLIQLEGSPSEIQATGSFKGLYRPGTTSWELGAFDSAGDAHGVDFSITSAGQIQYTSSNLTGTELESFIKFSIKKM